MTIGISFVLTLLVFSYLLGDNLLYRLALGVFVGLTAAFTSIVLLESVVLPLADGTPGNALLLVIAGLLVLLLLAKPFARLKALTNLSLALLIAVGAAVALVGAITGTLIPLIRQTTTLNTATTADLINGVIVLVGVVSSLLYFQFMARQGADGTIERGRIMQTVSVIGQGFVVVTLGALYGAAILTSLTILTGQLALFFGNG